jgi:opacity protein-like surface antigen
MKKIMVSSLVVAFLLLSASSLHAQKLYIGALGGYSSSTPKLPDLSTLEFDKSDSFFYGGRLGLKFSMLAIEAMYLRSDYKMDQLVTGVVDWDGETLEYQFVGVNAKLFPFSLAIFKPYITGGYGIYMTEISNVGKDNEGGYNFGVGLELQFANIALVVEGKRRVGKATIDGNELELGSYTLAAGINIYF